MRKLIIDGKTIQDNGNAYVIAEIGHNHQGKLEIAKKMFRVAKECGANAVKLQKRDNPSLYTREAYNKPYDNRNSYGSTYGEHREALEFGWVEYQELFDYARELGITMFSTAFDFASAAFLAKFDPPAFKIASGDLKNIPLLTHIAKFSKPMILSTGGATMEDVLRMSCYLADMEDFPRFNSVYVKYFTHNPPARSTFQAAKLPLDAQVEVDAIVAIPEKKMKK